MTDLEVTRRASIIRAIFDGRDSKAVLVVLTNAPEIAAAHALKLRVCECDARPEKHLHLKRR